MDKFPCDVGTCKKVYNRAADLGRHKRFEHGIVGKFSHKKGKAKANSHTPATLLEAIQALKVERDATNQIIARLEAML